MHSPHQIHEKPKSKKKRDFFDKLVIFASFVYPITAIPQIIQVYSGDCMGVAVESWLGFTLFSLLFLVYGIRNKVLPMIINYSLWFVMNGVIVIGAVMCK